MFSLVIPVYKNEQGIDDLIDCLINLNLKMDKSLEVVFVIDGSPDQCFQKLSLVLPTVPFASQLISHSRNFGSFSAIRTGLQFAKGDSFGVMAADLQEPPSLILDFASILMANEADVVIAVREGRDDPFLSRISSSVFWYLYRKLIFPDIPVGGVDIFGCNQKFRTEILKLTELNSSLIGLIFWVGFRRKTVTYSRLARLHGKSAWTFKKKMRYLNDSIYSFSDLPIRLLTFSGILSMSFSILLASASLISKIFGLISLPGYTATILTITFFGGLNSFGLGILGSYLWRCFENTKGRPSGIVANNSEFKGV